MADLIETITNAVADVEQGSVPDPVAGEATDTGSDPSTDVSADRSGDDGAGAAGPEAVSPSSRRAADDTTQPAAPPPPPPPDELTQELESFGMKAPTEGKEGRFRWTQVRKVVENTRKKLNDQHQQAIRVRDAQLAEATERVKNMDAVDKLIVTDPERYLGILASLHPDKYGRYVGRAAAAPAAPAPGEQPPGPDAQFSDGSRGYSPEGLQALMDWQAARVTQQVTEQVEQKYAQRFGPIEQEWKQTRAEAEFEKKHVPIVRSQIAAARETWGKPFTDHEAEIVKVLAENDGKEGRPFLSFDAAIAKVLVPKSRTSRDKMRQDVLAELQGRPAAAAHVGSPSAAGANGATGPRPLEDVIRQSIAQAGVR